MARITISAAAYTALDAGGGVRTRDGRWSIELPPETANQLEELRRCDESLSDLLIRLVRQQQQRKTAGNLLVRSK